MAKRKGRRPFRRYLRGNIQEDLDLGTLAAQTPVSALFDETVQERTLVSSIDVLWSMTDWTITTDAGPIIVGVAHSDYTDAEIEAYIENTGSWDEGDKVQSREIAKRLIRHVGVFDVAITNEISTLNDGKPIKTKLNWILTQGQTLRVWAYNQGQAAVATTTANVHLQGVAHLWPR